MWYFQCVANKNRRFVILPGKDYIIGRRDCEIVIENDQSVSRKHAILKVAHPDVNVTDVSKPSVITLKDTSKFGTFLNNAQVKGERQLKHGDEVRFGSPSSVHRIVFEPFVVSTSCVDSAGKKDVRALVRKLGGHVVNDWRSDCSFLVMKTVMVTIKVVCTLVQQKHIVRVEYLRDLVKHLSENGPEASCSSKPDPADYLPPVTERLISPGVSFHPSAQRSSVFLGMSFYFLSEKQFGKMSLTVELGGGIPILFDDPKAADLEAFLEDKAVVMNPAQGEVTDKAQKDWTEKVKLFLQKKGKFLVQDAEVGYAVLYCSTRDYCNPDKDASSLLAAPLPSQTQASASLASQQSFTAQSQTSSSSSTVPPALFRKPDAVGKTPTSQSLGVPTQTPASLPSAAAESQSQASDPPPPLAALFRKPDAATKTRATAPKGSSFSCNTSTADSLAVPGTDGDCKDGLGKERRRSETKNQEVFTVPESLTEESSSKLKGRGGRSQAGLVGSIKEESGEESLTEGSKKHRARSSAGVLDSGPSQMRVSARGRVTDSLPVKVEDGGGAATVPSSHNPPAGTCDASEALFDSELPTLSKIKKEKEEVTMQYEVETVPDSKPTNLLGDEDDDDDGVTDIRKAAPSSRRKRAVREMSDSDEEEDDPFDFLPKRSKGSTRREASPDPERDPGKRAATSRSRKSPSPTPEHDLGRRAARSRKSPSPEPDLGKRAASSRSRKSPSPTPERDLGKRAATSRSRKSPSPAPEPDLGKRGARSRKSPSPTPDLHLGKRAARSRKSPSPTPELHLGKRGARSRKSPSPTPGHSGVRTSRSPSPVPRGRSAKRAMSPTSEPDSKRTRRQPSPSPEPDGGRASPSLSPEPNKRARKQPSPSRGPGGDRASRSPSPSPKPDSKRARRPSPSREPDRDSRASRSPEPDTGSRASGSVVEPTRATRPQKKPSSSRTETGGDNDHEARPTHATDAPLPRGFLTTRQPIGDQVAKTEDFEEEAGAAPLVVVAFEDLLKRRTRTELPAPEEDRSDVPEGMTRWEGRLVPNFKKFRKVPHVGAGRLPRIIGGRDLEEWCGKSNKVMDDFLTELQEVEKEKNIRDIEAEKLFSWQPPTVKGRKNRR